MSYKITNSIDEVADMLDNLHIKPSNKISTYNMDLYTISSDYVGGIVSYVIAITRISESNFY